jgi:hypothetical protein
MAVTTDMSERKLFDILFFRNNSLIFLDFLVIKFSSDVDIDQYSRVIRCAGDNFSPHQ